LSGAGRTDVAYRLLHQTTCPSWLHPVLHGATTIWERWDGFTDERGFQAPSMNSFNHYALGSVGEWLYRGVAGLDQEPDGVAWRRLRIRPRPGALTWARATHESPRGRVEVAWERADGALRLDVLVPPGATAAVHVPTADVGAVYVDDVPVDDHEDVVRMGGDATTVVVRVASGRWRFDAPDPASQSTSSLIRTLRAAGDTAAAADGG
jgi:alpha-L-rhamnosidase